MVPVQTRINPLRRVRPHLFLGPDERFYLAVRQLHSLRAEPPQRLEGILQKLLTQFFVRQQLANQELHGFLRQGCGTP